MYYYFLYYIILEEAARVQEKSVYLTDVMENACSSNRMWDVVNVHVL